MNPSFEQEEIWRKDKANWNYGFYYNKLDKRIFVDKYNRSYGSTLNFANPKSYLALLLFLSFAGFIVFMIESKRQ